MTPIKTRITSTDFKEVVADAFEVLVDPEPRYPAKPAIGLKIDPINGESFIMPIEFQTAMDLAVMIMKTLLFHAPNLFKGKLF